MEQRIITIYCLIEKFLKSVSTKKEHKLSEISDSEVLFLGYISGKLESFLAQFGIELSALKRKNMRSDPNHRVKRKIKKGVETAFSVITAQFGKVIRATSIRGFFVKLKLFILAYSIDKFFKLSKEHQQLAFN